MRSKIIGVMADSFLISIHSGGWVAGGVDYEDRMHILNLERICNANYFLARCV